MSYKIQLFCLQNQLFSIGVQVWEFKWQVCRKNDFSMVEFVMISNSLEVNIVKFVTLDSSLENMVKFTTIAPIYLVNNYVLVNS